MMRSLFAAALAGGLALGMVSAHAVTITAEAPGVIPNGAGVETFNSATLGPIAGFSDPSLGIASITGGSFEQGSISGVVAAPYMGDPGRDTTTYLAVGGGVPGPGSPSIINFTGQQSSAEFYLGSIDTYNVFDFYLGAALVAQLTGTDLMNADPATLSASGAQDTFTSNRAFMVAGLLFDSLHLSSAQNALELDNLKVSAVPVPASLPLFASGLGLLGYLGLRKKRKAPGPMLA